MAYRDDMRRAWERINSFLRVLGGETTGPVPEDRDRLTVVSIAGGRASGRLVGGCLLDFIYTIGTSREPDLDGAIFFFEETATAPIGSTGPSCTSSR